MLPHIECNNDRECYKMPLMLFANEPCLELFANRVVVEHCPSWPAHVADRFKVFVEVPVILLLERLSERRTFVQFFCSSFELFEVIFVQAHSVELKRLASDKFGQRMSVLLGVLGVFRKQGRDGVKIFYIACIESEMLLD